MCSSKCTVALARAPKTFRMKSADTLIDTNPFACPTRLCRTFCLFLRHTLMLAVQAGNAHSSVIPKRLLRLCRLFTNCSANRLPWAYCACWHGCLQVCQQHSSTGEPTPNGFSARGRKQLCPLDTAPKHCDVQTAVAQRSLHIATFPYIATPNSVPGWGWFRSSDMHSRGMPEDVKTGGR